MNNTTDYILEAEKGTLKIIELFDNLDDAYEMMEDLIHQGYDASVILPLD